MPLSGLAGQPAWDSHRCRCTPAYLHPVPAAPTVPRCGDHSAGGTGPQGERGLQGGQLQPHCTLHCRACLLLLLPCQAIPTHPYYCMPRSACPAQPSLALPPWPPPPQVTAYLFDGYWEDIGTVRSFFEANLALTENVRLSRGCPLRF